MIMFIFSIVCILLAVFNMFIMYKELKFNNVTKNWSARIIIGHAFTMVCMFIVLFMGLKFLNISSAEKPIKFNDIVVINNGVENVILISYDKEPFRAITLPLTDGEADVKKIDKVTRLTHKNIFGWVNEDSDDKFRVRWKFSTADGDTAMRYYKLITHN